MCLNRSWSVSNRNGFFAFDLGFLQTLQIILYNNKKSENLSSNNIFLTGGLTEIVYTVSLDKISIHIKFFSLFPFVYLVTNWNKEVNKTKVEGIKIYQYYFLREFLKQNKLKTLILIII